MDYQLTIRTTDNSLPTTANLWHGYTMTTIDRIARISAAQATGRHVLDPDDAYEAAWGAIVEHLATTEDAPTTKELHTVAFRAVNGEANRVRQLRGTPRTGDGHTGEAARFTAYWSTQRVTGSPEDRVVERRALIQIWRTLDPRHQQTLWALALADGDRREAAALAQCAPTTFPIRLNAGRRHFRALWHEHETAPGHWGHDHRGATPTRQAGRHRITEGDLEVIRDRIAAGGPGSSQRAIATEYGYSQAALSKLLSGRTRPAPDPVSEAA